SGCSEKTAPRTRIHRNPHPWSCLHEKTICDFEATPPRGRSRSSRTIVGPARALGKTGCLLWVTTGHSPMSAKCPVCPKADLPILELSLASFSRTPPSRLRASPVSASPLPNGSSFLNYGFDEQMFGAEQQVPHERRSD